MVNKAGDVHCALHQSHALEESRVQGQLARNRFECKDILYELIAIIESEGKSSERSLNYMEKAAPGKKRKKRISAPGRMANPFSVKLSPVLGHISWESIYEDINRPLYVDIGCARGRVVERLALRRERFLWNHLGIEIRPDVVQECLSSWRRSESLVKDSIPKNIHYLALNFAASMDDLFFSLPRGILRLISFQFPDPWRTKKYLRRRIIQTDLVDRLVPHIAMGGFIYVSSDSHHLAIHMKKTLAASSHLRIVDVAAIKTIEEVKTMEKAWTLNGLYYKYPNEVNSATIDIKAEAKLFEETQGSFCNDDLDDAEKLLDDGTGWLPFNPLVAFQ